MNAADKLDAMAETFRQRNAVYSDNYKRIGAAMQAMFPNGLHLQTAEDFTRLYFLLATVTKTSRYATNFARGGHADSAHDAAVYFAMLEAYDADLRTDAGASDNSEVESRYRTEATDAAIGAGVDERERQRRAAASLQPKET